MKGGVGTDQIRKVLSEHTPLGLDLFEFSQIAKMSVDQGFIGQGPQMLGWLQFRRIRRQEEQMETLRDGESEAFMPSSAVEHQQDLFLFAGSYGLSEVLQGQCKDLNVHGGQEQPLRVSGGWVDKGIDVEPLVAMFHNSRWTLAVEHPDPTEEGLESDAMLIGGPEFDRGLWSSLLHLVEGFGEFF